MRLPLLALALTLAACSNTTETPQGFDRPDTVPPWAGDVTEDAETFVIHALDPLPADVEALGEGVELFHGHAILGTATLDDEADRREVVSQLWRGIAADDGTRASCFDPRHGIRVTRGDTYVDWVVCFQCLSLDVYDHEGNRLDLGTKAFVEPAISAVYRAAGLELAP